jgi:hypothetical protein
MAVSMTSLKSFPNGWAEPLYATVPTPGRDSLGWRLANVAEELGTPLMGWQRYVADVGLEVDPVTGRLAYKEIVVSVMRQNGKTTLVLAAELARCLLWGSEQRVAYTAQTGKDARAKFKDDHLPLLAKSGLNRFVKRPYLSDGNTALLWKNGSRISVLDNTPSAGHGKTLDLAVIDEAFADQDNAREQALLPTMATRLDPQIWNVSTAGTPASTYLYRKVETGRAAVRAGRSIGVAYFEWAIPEDEDVDDPAVWANRMPAYGLTIHEDYIHHARQTMTDGDFRRAIGNQWTETEDRVIPGEWWRAVAANDVKAEKPGVVAIDARADRSRAVIVRADANRNIQRVAVRPGVNWLVGEFLEHIPKSAPIAVAKNGPVSGIADDLEVAGYTQIERLDGLSVRKACTRFYDDIADNKLRVRGDDFFDLAVKSAVKRQSEDSWVWHRDAIGGDLLMAASIAYAQAVTDDIWEPLTSWA